MSMFKKLKRIPKFYKLLSIACIVLIFTSFSKSKEKPIVICEDFSEILTVPADIQKNHDMDVMLTKAFNEGRFNGNILYAENGKIIFNKQFGYENFSTKKALSDTSVFQLSSTSKPFTAIAVMQLYEKGEIDINKPVVAYLNDFPYPNITIKQLLQHRSGLPNYIYVSNKYWDKKKTLHNKDITPMFVKSKQKLVFTPGSKFQYCNTNYAYLALIVETISKKPFSEYMQEEIFVRLGMKHSFIYNHDERNNKHVVKGYSYSSKRGFYERPCDYLDGVVGDKDLYSTINDLFIFDQALYRSDFISPETLDLIFMPAEPFEGDHLRDYGLGFRLKMESDGQTVAYHHGWWKGFRSYFIHDFENKRTLIWLNNRSDVTVSEYLSAIMQSTEDEDLNIQLGGN